MTRIEEIVEREVSKVGVWRYQPELAAVCCEQHVDAAKAACLAVAKAVLGECKRIAMRHVDSSPHGTRPAMIWDEINSLAAPVAAKERR
jgi:hypothetical protein